MTIERKHSNERMSQIVIHGDTVYLAGQVAMDAAGESTGAQMKNIVDRIDKFLGEAGSDKSKILSATIWLVDMRDFAAINEVWDAWVSPGNQPARACVESRLATTQFTVEVGIVAAR